MTQGADTSSPHDLPLPERVVGAAGYGFSLSFARERSGDTTVRIDAMANGRTVAHGEGSATLMPGRNTPLAIALGSPADLGVDAPAPADLSGNDQATADAAIPPDLPTPVDLMTLPDLAEIPRNVPGLLLWLRADVGVTTLLNRVISWKNQGMIANDAVQGRMVHQPLVVANVQNGLPAVRFDGNDQLDFDGSMLAATSYTLFVVEARDTAQVSLILSGTGIMNQNQNLVFGYTKTNEMMLAHWSNDLLVPVPPYINKTFEFESALFDVNVGRRLYRGGFLIGADARKEPLAKYAGAALGSTYSQFTGDIAEILIYTSALSDADRILIEQYLKKRYALP
ncbi:MAG: hypothetical protein EXR72_18015 [Myxococcales bacterium]|nr:hypothetical protein [Myxococcales bacterium]